MILAVAVGMAACQPAASSGESTVRRPTAVRVVSVQRRTMRQTIDYVGTVGTERTLRVTARVPGTLAGLAVEEGNRVEKGDRLARVDAPELEAKLERVEAEVRRAKHERDFACETFETDRKLHERGAMSTAKLDRSRKRCASGREAVAAARASRREVDHRLAKRVERAPREGVVLERRAEPGEHVGPGRPLVVLGVGGREVVVPVVEGDLERGIGVGTPVRLAFGDGRTIESKVDRLDARASGPGRAVEVHIPLEGAGPSQVGASVDVSFVVAQAQDATPVPREAIVRGDEGPAIFIAEGETARRRAVEPGIEQGDRVAVRPELKPGQRVIVTNLDVLRDGMKVYAVEVAGGSQ